MASGVKRFPAQKARMVGLNLNVMVEELDKDALYERRNCSPRTPAYRFLNADFSELDIEEDPKWVAGEILGDLHQRPKRSKGEIVFSGRETLVKINITALRGVGPLNNFASIQLAYAELLVSMISEANNGAHPQHAFGLQLRGQSISTKTDVVSRLIACIERSDALMEDLRAPDKKDNPKAIAMVYVLKAQRGRNLAHLVHCAPEEAAKKQVPGPLSQVPEHSRAEFEAARMWFEDLKETMLRTHALSKALMYNIVHDEREFDSMMRTIAVQAVV